MSVATPPEAAQLTPEHPWPGLLAFNESFRGFFHGRGAELDDLFRRVRRETLTVLYAQSGLGKTSLLQAGLFPRLREEGFLPVSIRLDYGEAEPGVRPDADPPERQIAQAIAAAIRARGLSEASDPLKAPGIWEYLHDVEYALPDETGSPLAPVLVFDQFEELFTLGAARRDGGRFADRVAGLLGDLIENRPPHALDQAIKTAPGLVDRYDFTRANYRVLLSLREDYLPHLHGLRGTIPSIILNNTRLTRFDRRQALEVVEKPAQQRRLVTRQVAEAIVRSVAGRDAGEEPAAGRPDPRAGESSRERPGERLEVDPALLSLFCSELNERRRELGQAAISLELVAESKESVLRDFYLKCFDGLSPGVKAFVEDYLLTSKGYRDRLTLERARDILAADYQGRAEELDRLVDRRLLQIEERGKTPQVELTHDVLAPIALHERAERQRNEELRQAEARRQEELRRAEREEREAKAREAAAAAALAAARRQQRRTLALLGGVLVAAVAALGFGITAVQASKRAKGAEARALEARDAERSTAQRLRENQTALEQATTEARAQRDAAEASRATAEGALATAKLARSRADSVLGMFCGYTVDIVSILYDSTSSNSNLLNASGVLLTKSEAAIGQMLALNPEDPCAHRLDTREKTVAAQMLRQRGNSVAAAARVKSLAALGALRELASPRYDDPVTRQVAAQSAFDLTYLMWQLSVTDPTLSDSLLRAAALGIALGKRVPPTADSGAVNRVARIRHYVAIGLTTSRRFDSARATLAQALAEVESGKRRSDQNRGELEYTESQLWMRSGELDSAQGRTAASLQKFDSAVAIARSRHGRMGLLSSQRWLAIAHQSKGDMALALGRPAEALPAYDSSAAIWGRRAHRMRDREINDSSGAVSALENFTTVRISQAKVALRLGRLADAVRYAHAATDTATAIVEFRNEPATRTMLDRIYRQALNVFEAPETPALADSAYALWFRVDSLRAAAELAKPETGIGIGVRTLDRSISHIVTQLQNRFARDSQGKPDSTRNRLRRQQEALVTHYREREVWIHREIGRSVAAEDRDSLGIALGNLSWSYLLLGRAKDAAAAAEEGLRIAPTQTYIIANWFNAVLLSATEVDAQALFTRFAGRMIEDPAVRFECAILRDLKVLRGLGSATDQQVAAANRLVASSAPSLQCATPASQTSPN